MEEVAPHTINTLNNRVQNLVFLHGEKATRTRVAVADRFGCFMIGETRHKIVNGGLYAASTLLVSKIRAITYYF